MLMFSRFPSATDVLNALKHSQILPKPACHLISMYRLQSCRCLISEEVSQNVAVYTLSVPTDRLKNNRTDSYYTSFNITPWCGVCGSQRN